MPARQLPTGTVTFLFSDMERSTQLLNRLGTSAFTGLLEQHQRALRRVVEVNGGTEVSTEGDSFLVAFPNAPGAVQAAVGAQRALVDETWPEGVRVRVRIGIHTGVGALGGDNYVGLDVNRAARIAAAAHGGQVLLSDASRGLVESALPEGVRVHALGTYRLKDLPGTERLWQVEIHGLPTAFPPLRALDVRRAHLPPDATTFVGRHSELERLGRLLEERRLVTLTGPGGAGKTRLALRAASTFAARCRDGAFFVPLATVGEGHDVSRAVASTLNLPEETGRDAEVILGDWLGDREVLLVLDNLEQIRDAGGAIERMLTSSASVRVLATSRAPVGIAGEQEFRVPPLPAVDSTAAVETLESADAVRLFIDRAQLVDPELAPSPADLAVIAEIAAQVDGLPLAIELAAARLRVLPLRAIRDRLQRPLDALVGGPTNVPARQRTLRDSIAWSHELLDDAGRALFRRLAVFSGGWSLAAAEEVAASAPIRNVEAALEVLIGQSLVQSSRVAGEPRFTMLPTIAEFASEQLQASGESAAMTDRHARYVRKLGDEARAHADGPDRDTWFDRIEADIENVRIAIDRTAALDRALALGIAAALRPYWLQRNRGGEGLRILAALAEQAEAPAGREFADATAAAAAIATWLGDYAIGRRMGELSVTAYGGLDDRAGFADGVGSLAFATIEVDPERALVLNRQSLEAYRELGDVRGEGQALLGRATALFALGRLAETRESVEHSYRLLVQAGDQYFALFCSIFVARVKLLMGEGAAAVRDYRSMLETSRALDLRLGIAIGLDYLAEVAFIAGDDRRAVRLGATAARLKEELGGGVPPRMGGAPDPLVVGRTKLPPDEFDSQIEAGRAMDIDSAVAEALSIEPPEPSGRAIL